MLSPSKILIWLALVSLCGCRSDDAKDWNRLQENSSSDDVDGLLRHLRSFASCPHEVEARLKLEEQLWEGCVTKGIESFCESYLYNLPNSPRVADIRSKKNDLLYSQAKRRSTSEGWSDFLRGVPADDPRRKEADLAIRKLNSLERRNAPAKSQSTSPPLVQGTLRIGFVAEIEDASCILYGPSGNPAFSTKALTFSRRDFTRTTELVAGDYLAECSASLPAEPDHIQASVVLPSGSVQQVFEIMPNRETVIGIDREGNRLVTKVREGL